jgi:hypothetical protein
VKKSIKKISLGKKTRYIVTLVGEEILTPDDKRNKQWNMIQTIANTPDLMTCGPVSFDTMKMGFSGSQWVVEMQADVE